MMRKKHTVDHLPDPGDAFQFKVSSELYGICRVIRRCTAEEMARHGSPAVLCAISAWRGKDVPDPSDPLLRKIGTCTVIVGGKETKELQLLWVDAPPPPECVYLGRINPTAAEAETECFAFGAWQSFFWTERQGTADSPADLGKNAPSVSYSKLLDDAKLRGWRGGVPKKAANEARDLLRMAIQKVAERRSGDLGTIAVAAVQECVNELNRVEEKHGPFISTLEREDLCNILCSLLDLSGVSSPEEIIDEIRDW
jgi:hypothetical protein